MLCIFCTIFFAFSQNKKSFLKDATIQKRKQFYTNIVKSINNTIALPINTETEEQWINAFNNINLIQYKTLAVDDAINTVAKNIATQNDEFKIAFLNLIQSNYTRKYNNQAIQIFASTNNNKLMAMAANYILNNTTNNGIVDLQKRTMQKLKEEPSDAILYQLNLQLNSFGKKNTLPSLKPFFSKNYLPGQVLVFSFQRKNRNYPGLAIVRNSDGEFVKDTSGRCFSVGQLARSLSNMPGYISLGNTPQGFFRMYGFDTSKSFFIGPTTNVQLTMPFENIASHFFQDPTLKDTSWSIENYRKLLPQSFKNYEPLFGAYYAGKAGRTEIIAHGTTVDEQFYKSTTFYPYTPTAGCLCTKEIWDNNGYLKTSNQLALTQAIDNAGGPYGYLIVIELDDKKMPINLSEIIQFLH
ncbi:MAG: hypothetical protein ABL929_12290 [Ferruginibacter sp.]|nr:hypothetical protein [Ferruginibacter sp.]